MAQHAEDRYYVPHDTKWPIIGSIGMIIMILAWVGSPGGGDIFCCRNIVAPMKIGVM